MELIEDCKPIKYSDCGYSEEGGGAVGLIR